MTTQAPLTILHINTEKTFRGGEVQTLLLIRELNRRRHANHLIAQPDSPLAARAAEQGCAVAAIPMQGEFDLPAAGRIRSLIRQYQPDLLHAHNPHAGALALWSRFPWQKPRVILSRRVGLPIKRNPLSLLKYRAVDAVLAISHAVERQLSQSGLDAQKIYVAESCTDFEKLQGACHREAIRDRLKIPRHAFVVGNVAHFDHHKGQNFLIEAFARFVRRHPSVEARLLLVGEGPKLPHCRDLAARLRIGERVVFTGYRRDTPNLFRIMDVFFLSTVTPLEGWSVVLTEAMGSAVPVVAVRHPVTEERIRHDENGMLVSTDPGTDWCEAMATLCHDKRLSDRLAVTGRAYALRFTPDRLAEKTLHCYRAVLRGTMPS